MSQPEPTTIVAVRLLGTDEQHVRAAVRQLEHALGDAVLFEELQMRRRDTWLAAGSLHVAPTAPPTLADALQQLVDAARSGTEIAGDAWAAIEGTIRTAEAQLGAIWRIFAAENDADRATALRAAEALLRATGHAGAEPAPDSAHG